jgi:peptidoglycan/xylan/chitin deacetylase (PgdA/CDA1 family)
MLPVCLTVDVEPDCLPYLNGWRGVEEGLPRLLGLLEREGIRGTFFTTGETALRYPRAVQRIVDAEHELACHGHTHRPFTAMSSGEAEEEIARSAEVLRGFARVQAFRAPYLRLPPAHLPLLEAHGFTVDSSLARYKLDYLRGRPPTGLYRLPASVTSSALRLPPALRDRYLGVQRPPLVLFVHPWEFVDLTAAPIPWHCRLGTGEPALASLRDTVQMLRARGGRFLRIDELLREDAAIA